MIPDAVSQSAFSTVVDEGGSFDVIFPEGFNFKRDALKHRDGQRSSVEDGSGSRSGSAPSQCCLFSQSCDLWLVDAYRATVRMMDCIASAFTCPEPVAGSTAYNMIEKELQTAATPSAAHPALRYKHRRKRLCITSSDIISKDSLTSEASQGGRQNACCLRT